MFFFLSKTIDVLLSPLTWVLIGIAVAFWQDKRRKIRRIALISSFCCLYIPATEPVANRLIRSLEHNESAKLSTDKKYDVVVLLGGVSEDAPSAERGVPAYNNHVERLLTVFDLLRTNRIPRVIISGGPSHKFSGMPSEAAVLAVQLERWGIDPSRIIREEKALNTHDNAVESAKIIREKGWKQVVIVTSAYHMKRSRECFYAQGLAVDTLAVDFYSYNPAQFTGSLLPRPHAFFTSNWAIREWAGRLIYRVRGYARSSP
jgi:uncharacterized SAM-binding protein YcdF (DUF218 family)